MIEGTPIPYLLRNDTTVMLAFILSLSLGAFALWANGGNLMQNIKECLFSPSIKRLLNRETKLQFLCASLLLLQCFAQVGIILLYLWHSLYGYAPQQSLLPLGAGIAGAGLLFAAKYLLYGYINSTLFEPVERGLWLTAYTLSTELTGIVLLPAVVALLFFNAAPCVVLPYLILTVAIGRFFIIKGCFKIFFAKKYGLLSFILYFCALEVLPLLLAVRLAMGTGFNF